MIHVYHDVFVVVTRPLLRQIENLQSTFAAQTSSYERVEKNLTDRLCEHLLLIYLLFVYIFTAVWRSR